jgi:hypothetical protein
MAVIGSEAGGCNQVQGAAATMAFAAITATQLP